MYIYTYHEYIYIYIYIYIYDTSIHTHTLSPSLPLSLSHTQTHTHDDDIPYVGGTYRKWEDLDGTMYNIDEILLALELFYFQAQDEHVRKKIYSEIVKLLHPLPDPSRIDHNALVDTVIQVFEVEGIFETQEFLKEFFYEIPSTCGIVGTS